MRICIWLRQRRLRRLRRYARKSYAAEIDRLTILRRKLATALEIEKAKNRVQSVELEAMAKVAARNQMRTEAETTEWAARIAAMTSDPKGKRS